ncbi:hypothetical protein LA6_001174 [Marinibacterium anthonyi]|nr:hypothetical protein LA6_001174 [Marinibacterium anthonyi]
MKRNDKTDWRHVSELVDDLVHRVSRLRPDHRQPERFHEEKSEIEHDLLSLKRVLPAAKVYGSA